MEQEMEQAGDRDGLLAAAALDRTPHFLLLCGMDASQPSPSPRSEGFSPIPGCSRQRPNTAPVSNHGDPTEGGIGGCFLESSSKNGNIPPSSEPEKPEIPNIMPLPTADRAVQSDELAAPVIELAMEHLVAFTTDTSGRKVEQFLRAHPTGDTEADATVRRFIEYSVAVRRGRRTA